MPRGPSEAIVTKFLRDALAVDAVGVPELDEKARAKGLLGERQSITTAKVFKRAKKSLGIRSLRAGFGARSSVAVAITATERRLPQNRLRNHARTTRSHSNRLGPGGRLSRP